MKRSKKVSKPNFSTFSFFNKLNFGRNKRWMSDWLCSIQFNRSVYTKFKICQFSSTFENTENGRDIIGDYMKNYAIKNGTVITPLFNFYLELGLQCTKVYQFVHFVRKKIFSKFLQSMVDVRREGGENYQEL